MQVQKEKPAIAGGKPVRENFLVFGNPEIGQEEISDVVDSLRSGWLSTGPKVARFEKEFAQYIGCKNALALNSCTAGLHLSMIVSGIKQGDEVITTPMTFAATANAITHTGARPVFADIELPSCNIDVEQIRKKITKKTKAIMPVHLYGRPCNMDEIMEIARENDLLVIEDAAHAAEAFYHGKKIGNIGDLTCFSFYVTKNIACGEGGMVTTNNSEWAEKIQQFGLHGMSKGAWKRYSDEGFRHYEVVFPGYKYNMMDLQAAIGIHQLGRAEENLKKREKIWERYDEAFENLPLTVPAETGNATRHARHLYTIMPELEKIKASRDHIVEALRHENIGTGIHFVSLHQHKYYRETFGFRENDFPNARFVSERTISLPLSPKLSVQDVEDVVAAVEKILLFYGK